jgi:hypothetical protein
MKATVVRILKGVFPPTLGIAVMVVLLSMVCFFFVPSQLKVVDPYHHWFKPDKFKFEDYTGDPCIEKEVLAKLFPVGTDKAFVDRVLVHIPIFRTQTVLISWPAFSAHPIVRPFDHPFPRA